MLHSLQHSYDQIHIVITWHGQVNFLIVPVYIDTCTITSQLIKLVPAGLLSSPLLSAHPCWPNNPTYPGGILVIHLCLHCHCPVTVSPTIIGYRFDSLPSMSPVTALQSTLNFQKNNVQTSIHLSQFSFVLITQILTILDRMWWKTKVEYLS